MVFGIFAPASPHLILLMKKNFGFKEFKQFA